MMQLDSFLSPSTRFVLPIVAGILVFFFVILCEWLQSKRVNRVASLAFGPGGKAKTWTQIVPWLRTITLAIMTWSVLFLLLSKDSLFLDAEDPNNIDPNQVENLVLVLDYSPSMMLQDGGEKGEITRKDQMKVVVESLMDRLGNHVRYSLVCFYTRPMPMVENAFDKAIIKNILDDLPIERVMGPGKTDLTKAINKGLEIAEKKRKDSTTFIVVTDGDSLDLEEFSYMPESIKKSIVLGVGNTKAGISIDGHLSRQEAHSLKYVASTLKGNYIDVNNSHLASSHIKHLMKVGDSMVNRKWNLEDIAMALFIFLSILYALLPILQQYFGSHWKVVKPERIKALS